MQQVKEPLKTFDIIYEIKNFDVGSKHFSFGDVEIFKLTTDYLQKLLLSGKVSSIRTDAVEEWPDTSVIKTKVEAPEIDEVYEAGKTKANNVLNIIRLAAVRERISQLDDEMFLWELDKSITMPRVKPEKGTLLSISAQRGSRPLIVDMGNTITKGLESEKTWISILNGELPEDISRRLFRAAEWISHAVTSDSLDYKLVDLCTSLEIMLLPNHEGGPKGAPIALRQVLIGRGTSYTPEAVLYLYDKRSTIVHSGILNTTNHSEYWNLLICCFQVLASIVRLSKQYPHMQELKNLLDIVEDKEALEKFIKKCELGIYNGYKINSIKNYAVRLLKKCQ
jgi:hypothetical protein